MSKVGPVHDRVFSAPDKVFPVTDTLYPIPSRICLVTCYSFDTYLAEFVFELTELEL
jgi:hypothetical protein